ncbi:MAG: hypothetical protein ACYCSQ_00580 [bacterium]
MSIIKEKNEKNIRAYLDKSLYDKAEYLIKRADKYGIKISFRDIILKGLSLKEDEISKMKVSCELDKKQYGRFLKLRNTVKNLTIENVIRAGIKPSIEEEKKAIKIIA